MTAFPALRAVDAFPVEHEGDRLICISDPAGYVEAQLLLSPLAFYTAACLDGTRTVGQVREVLERQFDGLAAPPEQIDALVSYLDEQGFLLSPRFDTLRKEIDDGFRQSPVRRAYLAGRGYPAEPETLRTFLDELLGLAQAPARQDETAPRGLVVPHIDFARGRESYAAGYQRLAGCRPPETVFVFGVAHAGAPVPFVLTRKAFETPLGTLDTDQTALDALEAACAWDPYDWEGVHRTEHSIEFHAVLLAHLFGPQVKIVPILCATFCEEPDLKRPEVVPEVARFLKTCGELADQGAGRVCVIASADLAHVGRRFGDDFEIDDAALRVVAARDEEDLGWVMARQAEEFYASVMKDENARRVCGLGCIYATLKTLDGRADAAELLHYGYAPDPAGGVVSFAAVELA